MTAKVKTKQKNTHNKEIGIQGENVAAAFLERRDMNILERNWKCAAGEADIIALDNEALHFIEVKTRMGDGKGFPAESVNREKRRKYERIAEFYLRGYDGLETNVTFDIVSILVSESGRAFIKFYRNVLSCDFA